MDQKASLIRFYTKRTKRWYRLASSIHSYRKEISCFERLIPPKDECCNCFDTAKNLLDEAQDCLDKGFVDWGWKLFQAAERMELISLCGEDQRRSNAKLIFQEASKIQGWRAAAIRRLVEFENKPPNVEALFKAALIRDEHYTNNAYKDSLLRTQAVSLVIILFTILIALFFCLAFIQGLLPPLFDPCDKTNFAFATTYQVLFTVGLFGLLGGAISAIISSPKSPEVARIPEMTATFRVTFLRLFTSFASAIIIIIALHSNLGGKIISGVFSNDLANAIKDADPYTSYFIAICAGFSERLVKKAVEYVAGK